MFHSIDIFRYHGVKLEPLQRIIGALTYPKSIIAVHADPAPEDMTNISLFFVFPEAGAHQINAQPYKSTGKVVKQDDLPPWIAKINQFVLGVPLSHTRKPEQQDVERRRMKVCRFPFC